MNWIIAYIVCAMISITTCILMTKLYDKRDVTVGYLIVALGISAIPILNLSAPCAAICCFIADFAEGKKGVLNKVLF